jgi:hypothetical protein
MRSEVFRLALRAATRDGYESIEGTIMKAIAVNGSPRPQGNTEILLKKVLEPLEAAGNTNGQGVKDVWYVASP